MSERMIVGLEKELGNGALGLVSPPETVKQLAVGETIRLDDEKDIKGHYGYYWRRDKEDYVTLDLTTPPRKIVTNSELELIYRGPVSRIDWRDKEGKLRVGINNRIEVTVLEYWHEKITQNGKKRFIRINYLLAEY